MKKKSDIDRLNSQILSLRKDIDTYILRIKHTKNLSEDLFIQLKHFLPKPLPDPIIFEQSKYDQISKEIEDISETEKVQNYLFEAYEKILDKLNQKNQYLCDLKLNNGELNESNVTSNEISFKDDSDFLNYNANNSLSLENKSYISNNPKPNHRNSLLSHSAPLNKIQSLRRPMCLMQKINANRIKKSLELLNKNNTNTTKKTTLFLAKSLNCNDAKMNNIFNVTNNYKIPHPNETKKKYKTTIIINQDQQLSQDEPDKQFNLMSLTGSTKTLSKIEIEEQPNYIDNETEINDNIDSNEVKNDTNINNYMEELNDKNIIKKSQNKNDELEKIKKFFNPDKYLNSPANQNTAESIQKVIQMKERQALGQIPVTGKHLNNRKQQKIIEFVTNCLQNSLSVEKIVFRFFGTLDSSQIKSKLDQVRERNRTMSEYESEIHDLAIKLSLKREEIAISVQEAHLDNNGIKRIIFEGKKIEEMKKNALKSKIKQNKELTMQNKAITKGIMKIASTFELQNMKSEVTEFERLKKILKFISNVFQSNRDILLGFRYTQMTTKLSKQNNLQMLESNSSMRKVTFSNANLNFHSHALNVLSSTQQFERSPLGASKNSVVSSTAIFHGNMNVPEISLNSTNSVQEYIPGTRNSRRAFSAANSHRNSQIEQNDVDQELILIGSMIGQVFVERYVPEFIQYKEKICLQEREEVLFDDDPKIEEKLNGFQQPIEYLKSLFGLYRRYRSYLYLLAYEYDEIKHIDRSFFKFVSKRDQYIEYIISKKKFDRQLFVKEVSTYLLADEYACLWFIHDLVVKTDAKIMIPQLLQKISPIFNRLQSNISPTIDRDQAINFIPWAMVFSAFLENNKMPSTQESILGLCNDNLSKLIPVFFKSQCTAKCRAGLSCFFRLGCFLPHLFTSHVQFKNKATSILHNFIRSSINFPSCVKASTDFFVASWSLLDEETVMWHTTVFFHMIISEIVHQPLRDFNLNCFIAVMTLIVANRQKFTMDQLVKLNFLSFLIGNFNLEENVDMTKRPNIESNFFPLKDRKKSMAIIPESMKNRNVSYLDLPMFKMDQVDDDEENPLIASKNMENPKLQLHFQPIADEKMQKLASKKAKTSVNEYLSMRKKHPIYATHDVHCHFIQMVFATLIDHSLHRLDVLFCDPFPQVNRKPNVLYTLMKHMEMEENAYIVESLKEAFTPPKAVSAQADIFNSASCFSPITESELNDNDNDNDVGEEEINEELFQRNLSSILNESDDPRFGNNLSMAQFKSVPNFIAESKMDDIVIGSSVRRSSRAEVAKDFFRREQVSQFRDYQRLLRMVVPCLFHPEVYQGGTYIASGAFGSVNAVTLNGQLYAVKVLKKSKNEFDNPHLIDVYTEVSILENCKGDRRVTQLFDYGSTGESYYIVMEFYPMTLKSWRKKFMRSKKKPIENVLLRLFREFLNSATVLTDKRINHFDIKCDNVMLDRAGFPALADFGEAMSYKNEMNCITLLNKGTEWIKSPEMLSIALNSSATNPNYDRRKRVGAGPASDIWSIGCLFFELMTGEFLFVDSDWSRFFLRITDPKEKLINEETISLLGNNKQFQTFLEFVLQREVTHRPNLRQVIEKFDKMFPDALKGPLPEIEMPSFIS